MSRPHQGPTRAATEVLTPQACLTRAKDQAARESYRQAIRWAFTATDLSSDLVDWMSASALARRCQAHLPALPRRARVAVLGSYTTNQLVQLLPVAAARCGVDVELYECGFDLYRQEVLDPASGLYAFGPDVVVLAVHAGAMSLPEFSASPDDDVEREVERWTSLWKTISERTGARVVQHTFALPPDVALGHLAARTPGTRSAMAARVNSCLGAQAGAAVAVVDCEHLAAAVGKNVWFDPRYWFRSKQAVSLTCLPLLARHTAAVVAGLLGQAKKCLVLDLDNTVWGGILGEDGIGGIQLGGGPAGEAFVAFQSFVLELKSRGVVLAVCSKNNPDDVREAFAKHPDMRLKVEDIAILSAGWDDKAAQLRRIAETLGLGLDSLVFVDDNPAEREVIRQLVPEVDVIELPPEPAGYVRALASYPFFETAGLTAEDATRTELYRARARTAELQQQAATLDDFLGSLEMVATPVAADELTLPRVAQLIGKTNQFNLTGRRRSLAEVGELVTDPAWAVLPIRLRDRFADHGLVGVLIGSAGADEVFEIDTWLMSCRVIGRTLEHEMLRLAAEHALRLGCTSIRGSYVPTAKNALVADLYPRLGFRAERAGSDPGDVTTWIIGSEEIPASPGFIVVKP